MSKLDELRARNRHIRALPDDLKVTLRYPTPEDLATKAKLPLGVLRELKIRRVKAAEAEQTYTATDEEQAAEEAAVKATIRLAVVEIDGEDVRAEMRDPATDLEDVFTEAQALAILQFATRTEPDAEGKAP